MEIVEYNEQWPRIFQVEKELISSVITDMIDIQHIDSTAISQMSAKPIIDIAVLIPSLEGAEKYTTPLKQIGYQLFTDRSSVERIFFVKGEPAQYHLSLAQPEKFSYWKRQLLFRDYLREHHDLALEYQALKKYLIGKYPDGRQQYCDGKNEFVNKILALAAGSQN